MRLAAGLVSLLLLTTGSVPSPDTAPERVHPNDNRRPAGRLRDGVLRLALEVRPARWYPEADDGPSVVVPVFAEVGKAPSIPGPLVRVPAGTVVEVSIANRLADSTITIQGFLPRPATGRDSLPVPPGEVRKVRFAVGEPGTYFYRAWVGTPSGENEAEQLAGAFIVDPPGKVPPDRVFVINIWGEMVDSVTWQNAVAINGKAWPHTERLHLTVGDSARWRVVNASIRPHPMHLHGFYFNVESIGTLTGDTIYAPEARRLAVTEDLRAGRTMVMSWQAERPGNWLFHCHIGFHVIPEAARFDLRTTATHDHDHMAGLVLGIEVAPDRRYQPAPERSNPARLRMIVEELPRREDSLRTIGIALGAPGAEGAPTWPGPLLVATRGRPLDVTVVNRLTESTAIHWHGLELDSYWDGVAGWSGAGRQVAPPIAANDSFVAHLTVPRAGTFIYHTHLNDLSQMTAGLFGPLLVLEPGEVRDPARDHLFTIGWDRDERRGSPIVVNGARSASPLELEAGVPHRLRFVNIGVAIRVPIRLWRDSTLARWRVVAVDGADLPPAIQREGPARRLINVGMTFDAVFTPEPGRYLLRFASSDSTDFVRQELIAR